MCVAYLDENALGGKWKQGVLNVQMPVTMTWTIKWKRKQGKTQGGSWTEWPSICFYLEETRLGKLANDLIRCSTKQPQLPGYDAASLKVPSQMLSPFRVSFLVVNCTALEGWLLSMFWTLALSVLSHWFSFTFSEVSLVSALGNSSCTALCPHS